MQPTKHMLKTIEKVLLLQEMRLFDFVSTERVAEMAQMCLERSVAAGDVIFEAAQSVDNLYLLVRGKVELERNGMRLPLDSAIALNPWTFFSRQPQPLRATALEDGLVLVGQRSPLEELLTSDPELCYSVLRYLASEGLEGHC